MSKSTIFITLIEATKSKSGGFLFQNCKKDPLLFFSKRNLQNEFNLLDDPETNTIYEFLGDYWHGNPEVYDSEDINTNNGKTFKELYDNTFERLYEIKTLGYDVKYIWELDWIEKKLDGIKIL